MTLNLCRILVVGPAWIGDMVMAQSLFKLLRQTRPGCSVSVIAPAGTAPLLDRMDEVSESFPADFKHNRLQLIDRIRLGRELRDRKYDQAIVLPGSLKSAIVPWIAGIPVRTGYQQELRYGLLNDLRNRQWQELPLQVQRFVQLAQSSESPPVQTWPEPRLKAYPENAGSILAELGFPSSLEPVLALCPGAEFGPAKRWPPRHFAEIARNRLASDWQVWLIGSFKDSACAKAINTMVGGHCLDFTGRTSITQAIDLLSAATQVVSNDSGLMHIAAAVNTPLVAVYGSSSPKFTPPLSDRARTVSLELPCLCFKRACPLGHMECLEDLSPKQVLDALDKF